MRSLPRSAWTAAWLLGGALAAWIVTVVRMRGMDAGPGTDLGGIGWYAGVWVTMMAAMMLPSVAPMVLLFARVSTEGRRRGQVSVPTWVFVLSYLAVWALYGLVAYGLFRSVRALNLVFLAWNRAGPYVVGATVGVRSTSFLAAGAKDGSARSAWVPSTAPTVSAVAGG
jgi:hypothetical protein